MALFLNHSCNYKISAKVLKSIIKPSEMYWASYLFCFFLVLFSSCQTEQSQEPTTETSAVDSTDVLTNNSSTAKSTPVIFDSTQYKWQGNYLELSWSELSKVDFRREFVDSVGAEIDYPIFHDSLKVLDGKNIMVSGYIIPMEETGDETIIILSAFPYSQCFFCGLAGPESVIDIVPKGNMKRLKMDTKVTFKGKLKLNDTDLRYLYYILEEAELL